MKSMPKSIQKAFLLASAMSALATQGVFASQVAGGIVLADSVSNNTNSTTASNERERERE